MAAQSPPIAVHITTVHPSGDTRILHRQCVSLAEAGYSTYLIAQHDADKEVEGVRVVALTRPRGRLARMVRLPFAALTRALRLRADVYQLHDPELIPVGVLLRLLGKRVIFDAHETLPNQVMSKEYLWRPLRPLIAAGARCLEILAGVAMSAIVVANPDTIASFPRRKSTIVRNHPLLRELRADPGLPYAQRPQVIAYVGGLNAPRGGRELIASLELVARHQDCRLLFGGKISPAAFEEELQRQPGWAHVEHRGYLDRPGVWALMGQSRAGIVPFLPSAPHHALSMPNKLFEYMAAGLPVIASDLPNYRAVVEKADCGLLVDATSPEAIAEAVRWVLEHPVEAQAMGERGRAAVLSEYNWEAEATVLLDVYCGLIGDQAPALPS